ncbi:sensor histidine kinase [Bacillus sp. SM2101]|uniref:sensor histidine kinase n=1 Tax=Bacillus sp. SM2101 TaxID=2805366 RepID=UPI001BDE4CEB|nr:sensor histidine kinase [Bacillus sp. SM2101]
MTFFLLMVIGLLTIVIFVQYKSMRNRDNDITYIYKKLSNIITQDSSEKLLLVTSHNELQMLLIEINRLLNKNQQMISDFTKLEISMKKMLSNISHDLKTPLTVVLGYIETIIQNPNISMEERNRLLTKIHNKTIEVSELINKFFDLAKLESGDKEIALTRVNMNEICKKNILSFYDILTAEGFKVVIDIPENTIFSLANEEALDRILNNLISNAIQYGSDGKTIGINLSNDPEYVYVEVWDKGKGIHELHKDLVFERLFTLDDSRNKQFQGSGLGLTITKRLIEELSGEITLHSIPHEKTSFCFKLNRLTL